MTQKMQVCTNQTLKVFFPEEEGEEESPLEEDDVVWTPFLGPNPMTEIEFLFEDLFLVEVSHVITEPLQQVLGSNYRCL